MLSHKQLVKSIDMYEYMAKCAGIISTTFCVYRQKYNTNHYNINIFITPFRNIIGITYKS